MRSLGTRMETSKNPGINGVRTIGFVYDEVFLRHEPREWHPAPAYQHHHNPEDLSLWPKLIPQKTGKILKKADCLFAKRPLRLAHPLNIP